MTIYQALDWLYKPVKINQDLYPQIQRKLLQIWRYKFDKKIFEMINKKFTL
jgi:hypothetical protein